MRETRLDCLLTGTSRLAALLLLSLVTLTGCGRGDDPGRSTLRVHAASSLTEAFDALEHVYESSHPATDIVLTLAGSQILRLQIEHGAHADVFASANPDHMAALVEAGMIRDSRVFAHNELVVIVPTANPAGIESFSDLVRASRLVLGTENVPVGRYSRQAIALAAKRLGADFEKTLLSRVVSVENNVRLVRAKVELGEADAAIVYRTDAVSSKRVQVIPIPSEVNVRGAYPMGVIANSRDPILAERWLAFVLSPRGQDILARHGFVVEP